MENLNNLFVPSEIATKLKEIGFNEPCFGYLDNNDKFKFFADLKNCNTNSEFGFYPTVPTYEQVKLWFMENHLIFITVNCEKWLHEFRGEVETSNKLYVTEIFNDYNEAFNASINAAIPFINNDNN
jgi:hypothetical protein